MTTASKHVVTGHHCGAAHPTVVATTPTQRNELVGILLTHPHTGKYADRLHAKAEFYVDDHPIYPETGEVPTRALRVGFHQDHGGAVLIDTQPEEGEDWAWLATRETPLANPPAVYFDQDAEIMFPPNAVFPLAELAEIINEFCATGNHPRRAAWRVTNSITW